MKPVPAPRTTSGTRSALQSRAIAATVSGIRGKDDDVRRMAFAERVDAVGVERRGVRRDVLSADDVPQLWKRCD